MDTDRILKKVIEENQEKKEEFGIGTNAVNYIIRINPQLRNEAIIVARRNGTTLSQYIRKCIRELVEQHKDNDQPRIERWTANSPIRAWPIPQLDLKPSRFKGWNKKQIQEYEDALRSTLRSIEQAKLAMWMQDRNYHDPGGENKEEDE